MQVSAFGTSNRQRVAEVLTPPQKPKSYFDQSGQEPHRSARDKAPEWAQGLRHLYDTVVQEPLPDNFKDLLAKLDQDT